MKSIFERIIDGELPSEKIIENEFLIVIRDIAPVSTHHFLIVPKEHYPTLEELPEKSFNIIHEMIKAARCLSKMFSLENKYRLLINVGEKGGQSVFHLHMHFIGGDIEDKKSLLG